MPPDPDHPTPSSLALRLDALSPGRVPRPRSRGARYAWSAAAWLVAFGLTVALSASLQRTNFLFFWLALLFAAWYGGLLPAIAVAVGAVLAVNYLFIPPPGELRIGSVTDVLPLALFGAAALLVSALATQLARTQRTLAGHMRELARLAASLEDANQALARQREEAETAREHAERVRRVAEEARRSADDANRAKSEFLATMSHEIRTPINAITGYSQLIELGIAGPVTDGQRDYLARLGSSARHLLALVDDVLDLAKVDAGALRIVQERALTGVAVAAALDLVRPQAEERGVHLVDARAGDPGEPYLGDEHRVRQVLVNLLSNAVKFTGPGGTVRVVCGCERGAAGPRAYIRVEDTGIGIPADQQRAVFEPFHQVERGLTRGAEGIGLGLAISRRLARLMGGDLTLQSVPGEGSAFTLWLPPARARAAADPATPRDRPATSGPAGPGDGNGDGGAVRPLLDRRAPPLASARVVGLAEFGTHLRQHVESVVERMAERLREDDAFPQAARLRRAELEDHQLSFLADLAQTLVAIEETEGTESDLLRDGSEIQRLVAELHGRMRQRRGWTAAQLEREYAILGEELEALARRLAAAPEGSTALAGSTDAAFAVLGQLLRRATDVAVRALRRAEQEAAAA